MATIEGALLLGISSPYWRRGVLGTKYRTYFGRETDVLVWKAETRLMNPSVPQATVDRALEEDEPRARAEYLAEFRTDIEGFLSREVVEACAIEGPARTACPRRRPISRLRIHPAVRVTRSRWQSDMRSSAA